MIRAILGDVVAFAVEDPRTTLAYAAAAPLLVTAVVCWVGGMAVFVVVMGKLR